MAPPDQPPDVEHQRRKEIKEADRIAEYRIIVEIAPLAGRHMEMESVCRRDDQQRLIEDEKPVALYIHILCHLIRIKKKP